MGLGGISMWQLLIVLLIVVLIFGTKKLKGMGSDLGGAIKGFKSALTDDKKEDSSTTTEAEKPTQEENSASKTGASDQENDKPNP